MPPPPPAPENLSELEQVQQKADTVTNESLESTRRMMALCDETKEAGIRTLVALDDQGEQLDHIEKGMIQINQDMREAEKNMQGMASCFAACTPSCLKSKEMKETEKIWKANEDGNKGSNNQPMKLLDDTGIPSYGGFVSRITNDSREDEMEKNCEQISNMVGNIRSMALDMSNEISTQNETLDRINSQAASNDARIKVANEGASKLLKQ